MKKREWIEERDKEEYYYDKGILHHSDDNYDSLDEYEMNIMRHESYYDNDDYDTPCIGHFSDY